MFILSTIFVVFLITSPIISNELVDAAKEQIGKTVYYDPSYQILDYPNGDVPIERGVCTDVVIRAMRKAYHFDLQKEVHEEMKKNFAQYPQRWGLKRPDKNIDHRRVPNLRTFFKRRGWEIEWSGELENFQPGDVVTCIVPPHLPHIMIVSDETTSNNVPLVIHNIGSGTKEEDMLLDFELTGHYRILGLPRESDSTQRSRRGETQSSQREGFNFKNF